MGLFGLGKGIIKTVTGVIEGDGEKILKGVGKTAINVVTTVTNLASGNTEDAVSGNSAEELDD